MLLGPNMPKHVLAPKRIAHTWPAKPGLRKVRKVGIILHHPSPTFTLK